MRPPGPPGVPGPGPGPGSGWGPPGPGGCIGGLIDNLCASISSCFYLLCCCWCLQDCFAGHLVPPLGPPGGPPGPPGGPPGPPGGPPGGGPW